MCIINLDYKLFNPFMPSGLFYHNTLDRSISKIRDVWLQISELNANSEDPVLQCLIWVYTVCQCPFYGTLGLNGLRKQTLQSHIHTQTHRQTDNTHSYMHIHLLIIILSQSLQIKFSLRSLQDLGLTKSGFKTTICSLSSAAVRPVLCTFFRQKLTTVLLESAEGRE